MVKEDAIWDVNTGQSAKLEVLFKMRCGWISTYLLFTLNPAKKKSNNMLTR